MENLFHSSQHRSKSDLLKTYIHLERYVNDGSPSGFEMGIQKEYSPFNQKQYFELPVYIDTNINHIQVGSLPRGWPDHILKENEIPIPIHPGVLKKILRSYGFLRDLKSKSILVQPTSSGRTVFWDQDPDHAHFIKLHYPELIGRFNRDLNLFKWLSTIEKAKELYSNIKSFPKTLGFLNDFGGIYMQTKGEGHGFGLIFRDVIPLPIQNSDPKILIPLFSLFPRSRLGGRKYPILMDVIEIIGKEPQSFLNKLLYPLIDAYCYLAFDLGLIPECNAQNLLYEINISNMDTRIIFRDNGDIFIDCEVRNALGLHNNFCTYKTLDPRKDNDVLMRRSFSYDFKLSEYVLKPLIELYSEYISIPSNSLQSMVKDYFNSKSHDFEGYFASKKYWYAYPKKKGVGRSSYIKIEEPPSFR